MRKATAIILCLFMLVGVVPLFSAGRAEPGATAASELRIMWWGSQLRHEMTIGAIDVFREQNPGVTVNFEFAGFTDYWTRLTTMAAGRNLPDIIQHDYAFLAEWQSRNQLLALDEFVNAGIIDISDIDDSLLDGGRIDGRLYGINLGSNAQAVIIDRAVFNEAGIEVPDWDWTWDDFEEIALAIRERTGRWAIGATLHNDLVWETIYLSHGYHLYDVEAGTLEYSDDGPFIRHFEMLLRLQNADAIPHISEWLASFETAGVEATPIVTGEAAMQYIWSNQAIAISNAAGEGRDFVLRPLPRAGEQGAVYIKPSQFFSITRDSRNPELAARFLNMFTNDVTVNRILRAERGVPVASTVRRDLAERVSPAEIAVFEYIAEVTNWASPIPPALPPGHGDVRNNVYTPRVAEAILFERITPQMGAEILRNEVANILGGN